MKPKVRTKVISLRVTAEVNRLLVMTVAAVTTKTGRRHTLTDVMERGIRTVAKEEGVK